MRGVSIDYSTIQRWVFKFTPHVIAKVRSKKHQVEKRWRMDETYVKVKGQWVNCTEQLTRLVIKLTTHKS